MAWITPGFFILIMGFIFFASIFGGGEKKMEEMEKMAKITSSFIASIFTISGIVLLLTLPIFLIIGMMVNQMKKIVKFFKI